MDLDAVRQLALALPEAHEEPHFDLTSFRVGTKIFATAPPDGGVVRVFVDESEARACVAEALTGVELLLWGEKVSGVSVSLATADARRVAELLEESWRRRAPKRAIAAFDAPRPQPNDLTRPVPARSTRTRRFSSVHQMPIKLENVGIAVRDIEATIAFFTDLGLTVVGRDTVSGEWADTAVGLDGNHARIAMLQTPNGNGVLELFEYIHPDAIETEPTRPNEIGMHRVAFSVDDIDQALEVAARHGCFPLRGVATYEDIYKLAYVRGPSGIIVMLAQELKMS